MDGGLTPHPHTGGGGGGGAGRGSTPTPTITHTTVQAVQESLREGQKGQKHTNRHTHKKSTVQASDQCLTIFK